MIGLDTNILARYYIDDENDPESQRQKKLARQLIESGKALMVCKTVLLEFEWVLRGYYHFNAADIAKVLTHILAQPHIQIEDLAVVKQALLNYQKGLGFADALHHASYAQCESMASFDDRKFARRSQRFGLIPTIFVPKTRQT